MQVWQFATPVLHKAQVSVERYELLLQELQIDALEHAAQLFPH